MKIHPNATSLPNKDLKMPSNKIHEQDTFFKKGDLGKYTI
jgi:hypothetical protein